MLLQTRQTKAAWQNLCLEPQRNCECELLYYFLCAFFIHVFVTLKEVNKWSMSYKV